MDRAMTFQGLEISIDEVVRTKQPSRKYNCPECRQPVEAVINHPTPHFRHAFWNEDCDLCVTPTNSKVSEFDIKFKNIIIHEPFSPKMDEYFKWLYPRMKGNELDFFSTLIPLVKQENRKIFDILYAYSHEFNKYATPTYNDRFKWIIFQNEHHRLTGEWGLDVRTGTKFVKVDLNFYFNRVSRFLVGIMKALYPDKRIHYLEFIESTLPNEDILNEFPDDHYFGYTDPLFRMKKIIIKRKNEKRITIESDTFISYCKTNNIHLSVSNALFSDRATKSKNGMIIFDNKRISSESCFFEYYW